MCLKLRSEEQVIFNMKPLNSVVFFVAICLLIGQLIFEERTGANPVPASFNVNEIGENISTTINIKIGRMCFHTRWGDLNCTFSLGGFSVGAVAPPESPEVRISDNLQK